MPRLKTIITLREDQKRILKKLSEGRTTEQQIAIRAKIVLYSVAGKSKKAILRKLGVSESTVRRWRKRWRELSPELTQMLQDKGSSIKQDQLLKKRIEQILRDAPRSGKPPTITDAQNHEIVLLACMKPEEVGVPISDWTHEVLSREAIKRGIVESISTTQVWKILKKCRPSSSS